MQKVLSVSVAAYNVQDYIRQCLDSFLGEGITERVEVLVTDDGSGDSTPEIVAEYAEKYPGSFVLIRQENAGPGSTVNSGIRHATGKYFRMVDGDDWVNTADMSAYLDFLESHDADMVLTHYCRVDHVSGRREPARLEAPVWDEVIPFEDVCGDLDLAMHNITYRTALLQENGFRVDNSFYTDAEYVAFPVPWVKSAAFLDRTIYMYRVALAGQSMNIQSLQRNVAVHRNVLNHLTEAYARCEAAGGAGPNTLAFLRRFIAARAGMQLTIHLTFPDRKEYARETRRMMEDIRAASPALYETVCRARSFRLLDRTRGRLFPLLAAWQSRKLTGE